MSRTTVAGILVSVAILIFAVTSQTVGVEVFINPAGLAIVIGGTTAAVLVSYSFKDVVRVIRILAIVVSKQSIELGNTVSELSGIARRARRRGLLSLQSEVHYLKELFLKDGMQMLIDGYRPDEVEEILTQRILNRQGVEQAEARIFRTMAKFAPAFGMLGTVIGLIAMLQKMTGSSLENIGPSMAVALVTTFYGLILANMVFNPIAEKLERRSDERAKLMTLIRDGVVMIGREWHPDKIHDALNSFLMPAERQKPARKWDQ